MAVIEQELQRVRVPIEAKPNNVEINITNEHQMLDHTAHTIRKNLLYRKSFDCCRF